MPAIRCSLVAIVLLGMVQAASAEKLDRGVVAVKRSDGAVLVSWRLLATDPVDVVFNVWREEIITCVPGELRIYTIGIPANTRRVCLMQNRLYRTDVAMASMGYFYPPQLGIE